MFAQFVVGTPGAGKTTYCRGMKTYLQSRGREVATVNLDPANEVGGMEFDVDIFDLIQLEDVTERLHLGPNGGLIYCMEHLAENLDWLKEQLAPHKDAYLLFDCPGQVELYTHNDAMKTIVGTLQQSWGMQLCCVNLVDCHHCYDQSKFVSVLLTCLSTMIQLELPHINVLSKIDLIDEEQLPLNLDVFTDVLDLSYLVGTMHDDDVTERHVRLTNAIADVITDFGLVFFIPLDIQSDDSKKNVIQSADKACGYLFEDRLDETSASNVARDVAAAQ